MEPPLDITSCPLPSETNELLPMLVVIGVFVLAGWLFQRWNRSRRLPPRK